jgi:hypothetical protein
VPQAGGAGINGLYFRLLFFDFIYMMGDFLSALSELHVKVQLVDRYCNKVLHNLHLMEKRAASVEEMRAFIRDANQEMVHGLERQDMFYDKYCLKLVRLAHRDTQGELAVEDTYNGPLYLVRIKRILDALLSHTHDSTAVPEMGLFTMQQAVMDLTTTVDAQPGESARRTLLELHQAARNVHVHVKKEKLVSVDYLLAGKPVQDGKIVAAVESMSGDLERFLQDPRVRSLFTGAVAS